MLKTMSIRQKGRIPKCSEEREKVQNRQNKKNDRTVLEYQLTQIQNEKAGQGRWCVEREPYWTLSLSLSYGLSSCVEK